METLKKNLARLVKVKTLVTIIVITVWAVLALRGDITADNVMNVVMAVIAFYFGTQHEKTLPTEYVLRAKAEPVEVVADTAVAEPEPADNDTYSKIHPDEQ